MTKSLNTKTTATNGAAHEAVNGAAKPKATKRVRHDDAEVAQAQVEFAEATDGFWSTLGAFWEAPSAPTATRKIVELVARVVLYAVGAVATCYVVSAMSAAFMAGGIPLFMIMVAEIIVFILGLLAAWHLSDATVDYLAAGNLSRDAKRLGSWVTAKFTSASTYVKQSMVREAQPVVH